MSVGNAIRLYVKTKFYGIRWGNSFAGYLSLLKFLNPWRSVTAHLIYIRRNYLVKAHG